MSDRRDITIVSGGHSVAAVALDRLAGTIIAVNDSALKLPRWEHAISMDRLWAEHRLNTTIQIAALMSPTPKIWMRSNALQRIRGEHWKEWVTPFDCNHETNEFTPQLQRPDHEGVAWLNGMSSGACAINLAYHLKPTRLFLLGFDMNRDRRGAAHWYPPYPWANTKGGSTSQGKYREWALHFDAAARSFAEIGCTVYNVSPGSLIETFPKITPAEYIRMSR